MLYFVVADNLIFSPSYYWGAGEEGRGEKVKACTRDLSVMSFLNFQKTGSKLTIKKLGSWHLVPSLHGKLMGEK